MSKIDVTKPPHPAVIKPASVAAAEGDDVVSGSAQGADAGDAQAGDVRVDDVAAALAGGGADDTKAADGDGDGNAADVADAGDVSLADLLDDAVESLTSSAPAGERERSGGDQPSDHARRSEPDARPEPSDAGRTQAGRSAHLRDDDLTEAELRQYGASEPFVAKVARREARGVMAEMQRRLDDMQRRLDEALGSVSSVAERTTNVARAQFEAALASRVPDLQQLVSNPKFKAFLRRRVPGAGVTWGQALADATRSMSVQRVVEVIEASRAAVGVTAPGGAVAPKGRSGVPSAGSASRGSSRGAALTDDAFARIDNAITAVLRAAPPGAVDGEALNLARDSIYGKMREGITVKEALEIVRSAKGGQEVINRLRQ